MGNMSSLGAEYLVHNSVKYHNYLDDIGIDVADVYELLLGQFVDDLLDGEKFVQQLQRPVILHSTALSIAGHPRMSERTVGTLNYVDVLGVEWVGDHLCYTGTPSTCAGGLLPPLLSEDQINIIQSNLKNVLPRLHKPLANVNMHYALGNLRLSDIFNNISEKTDVKLIVSLENLSQSVNHYHPVDHKQFISQLNYKHIIQIHCTLGNSEEQKRSPTLQQKQLHHCEISEWMASEGIRPLAVIFELETETDNLPDPRELTERILWAKELFFSDRPLTETTKV
ncbi:MAG: DUF692 domain-containing protein [Firmicutes bacterium]|nr:DUF692 domain-containing protein [Bacillota bacterium]